MPNSNEDELDAVKYLPLPTQGRADWREYRPLRIDANGVTVLLVHDRESKTLAAAATVNVGASSDPRSRSGLAHFCEHMCFLGSKKYPGENEYKAYLSKHGGRSNASTSMHVTTYKFEILSDFGDHALDLFAQFFKEPLFTSGGTDREVRAVDSENSKNLVADGRRRLQILKALGDQSHYYTKFTTGNQKTLPTLDNADCPVRRELLDFHRLHYQPDRLTVVVAGPQSLDELQAMVVPKFSPMKVQDFPKEGERTESEKLIWEAAQEAPPYGHDAPIPKFRSAFGATGSQSWPFMYISKPLRSVRKLSLMFPVPPSPDPDQSPSSALSHILGHEGRGSVFSILQNKGLASGLSAGLRVQAPDFGLFQVEIQLTPEGEQAWPDVVQVTLEQCRKLRECEDVEALKRVWGESAQLANIQFHSASPTGVYDLCPRLSQSVLRHGTAKSLAAGSMLDESAATFPLEEIRKFLNQLTLDNLMIERCSEAAWKEAKSDDATLLKEPWYDIEYATQPINKSIIEKWNERDAFPDLSLPQPNQFIPRSLDLCDDLPPEAKEGPRIDQEMKPPVLLSENRIGRLWHRLDDRYALPKSVLHILIRNASVQNVWDGTTWKPCPKAAIHASLLSACFSEALAQDTYDANLAGLYWSVSMGESGITISCSGFSDRLSDLALQVLGEFLQDFIQDHLFASTRDRLLQNLSSYLTSRRADSHAAYYRDLLLSSGSDGIEHSIQACKEASLDSLRKYHAELWANKEQTVECLYVGNIGANQAKEFYEEVGRVLETRIKSWRGKAPEDQALWIPGGKEHRLYPGQSLELHFSSLNQQEENGAVTFTYQSNVPGFRGNGRSPVESLRSTATIRLLSHILREPLFNELRTKQTLGYIVSSYYDLGISNRPAEQATLGPLCVPIDLLEISVLSRKVSPPEVAQRIDAFLTDFRDHLEQMPASEIESHATALSTKLLKPIQKLSSEAATQFSKIRRFAPELRDDLPWNSIASLAGQIKATNRQDLLQTWDRMMLPHSRSRAVTCVYGTTFPLDACRTQLPRKKVLNSIPELLRIRQSLPSFDNSTVRKKPFPGLQRVATWSLMGAAAGALGWTLFVRSRKTSA